MRVRAFCLGLVVCLVPVVSHAQFSFFGYTRDVAWDDSSVSFTERQLGSVTLERSEIAVTPRGSYLDIVEDAWISGNTDSYYSSYYGGDLTTDFFIQGRIQMPPRTVLVGLLVWDGATAYRAKLHSSEGGLTPAVYDDSLAWREKINGNIGTIEEVGPSSYKVTFQKLSIGEARHVRIRYLIGNTGGGAPEYALPIIFSNVYGGRPDQLRLTVSPSLDGQTYTLVTSQQRLLLEGNAVNYIPFASPVQILSTSLSPTTMQLTTFDNGPWAGSYLLLNTVVPDSVLGLLSQPIQTVFLWRWNAPQTFTETYNQSRQISGFGYQAIDQARSIQGVISTLAGQGHKAGLVHSIEGKAPTSFALSEKNSSVYRGLQEYLGRIDVDYILASYGEGSTSKPSWAPQEVTNKSGTDNAREEFLQSVSVAHGLFTDSAGVLRHLVIVSCGPIKDIPDKMGKEVLDSLFRGISTDATQASWSGVDFSDRAAHAGDSLTWYQGYLFPEFTPRTISLTISNSNETLSFPLAIQNTASFSCIAKASGSWDSTITWRGYNVQGRQTGSVVVPSPVFNRVVNDSGLVKLWAGDENRLSEEYETGLGATYGIITKEYSLRAGVSDATTVAGKGVAYLSGDEIVRPPVAAIQDGLVEHRETPFSYRLAQGVLTILGCKPAERIQIFDVTGRQLADIRLADPSESGFHEVRLSDYPSLRGNRLLIVKITGNAYHKTFTIAMGGRA